MCSPIALVVEEVVEDEDEEDEKDEKVVCLNSEGLSVNGVMVLMILELDFGLSNPEFSWNRDNGAEEECLSTLKNR